MGILEEFDAFYSKVNEEKLPCEFTEQYDITECLSSVDGCDTLLVKEKATDKKMVAKCYAAGSLLFDKAESAQLAGIKSDAVPHFMGEYRNESYRCVLREYVEGISLEEFVRENRLTEEVITDIAVELAKNMQVLHNLDPVVIHRDIKPQNIIIKKDGSIALIDFGISRVYKKDVESDTVFYGTENFAPPEQYGFMQTDIRSDIYSFGIVLSWLITGKAKPIKEPLTKLERIAAKCCEFLPENRYKNDEALLKDLRRTTREHALRTRKIIKRAVAVFLVLAAVLTVGGCLFRALGGEKGVAFQEPLIEKAVRAMLNKPEGAITCTELESITGIYIQGPEVYTSVDDFFDEGGKWYSSDERIRGSITDLSDLRNMPNLRIILLGGQYIRDLSPLADLQYLQRVEFRDNYISDLSPLANKSMLSDACFLSNQLTGIEAVNTWQAIRNLNLSGTGYYDGSPIGSLRHMESLDINNNSDAYKYLAGIYVNELFLGAAGQTDLECIKDVAYVSKLYIRWSDIRDISALTGREDISYLNMESCVIDDLSPLYSMPNLRTVEMSVWEKKQMEELIPIYGEPAFEIIYIE